MCDTCRIRLYAFDSVGGALLSGQVCAPMAPGSMQASLAAANAGRTAPPTPRQRSILPAPLISYIGGDLEDIKWRAVGMGVRQAILPTDKRATARLLYIPAGSAVPDHGHRGTEMTLVLQGSFSDNTARFATGDIEIADEDLNHTPVAGIEADCICLAATDAPLRFRGLIPRIAQPFLRI